MGKSERTRVAWAALVMVSMVSLVGCQGFGLLDQPPQVSFTVSPDPKTIKVGDLVTLDGSASSDPQGYALTYQWTFKPPTASAATLSSTTAKVVTFTPDIEGQFRVSLVVTAKSLSDYSETKLLDAKASDLLNPVLTVQSDGHGSVTPLTYTFLTEGESVKVSAKPDDNYTFKEWKIVSGDPVIDDKTKADAKVTLALGKATIEALFTSTSPPPRFLGWTGSLDIAHPNELVRVTATGTTTSIGGMGYMVSLAFNGTTLYGAGNSLYAKGSRLYVIDTAAGTVDEGKLFHTATEASVVMAGLAVSPLGTVYAVEAADPRRVFTVDPATGELTWVGTPTVAIKALAVSPAGVLYGSTGKSLYKLSTSTAKATSVGDFGDGISLTSLAFSATGTLYGVNSPSTAVYTVDPALATAQSYFVPDTTGLLCLTVDGSKATGTTTN